MNNHIFSRYNILFEAAGKPYIYNTLSTAIAGLDTQTAAAIETGNIDAVAPQFIDIMKGQHFIVGVSENEIDEYLYFYDRTRFGKSAKSLSINFIPTYNCNLACPYCLQGLSKVNKNMSRDDVNKILMFIESKVQSSQETDIPISKINIHLYGGEPMMQKETLVFFCDRAQIIAGKYNTQITYSMTSNLTLLDDEIIGLMEKYHICTQVSIDGTKEQHNKRRITKNGSGTYNTILKNLCRLTEKGLKDCITIRLNIDEANIEEAEDIMRSVHEYSNDVYFGFLDNFKGFNDSFFGCISNEMYPQIVSQKFNEIYRKFGFDIPQPFGKMSPCSLNSENKYFIDCYLDVYKCEMLLNQPASRVGKISSDGTFMPESGFYHQMSRSPKAFTDCCNCKLLPLCAGGCAGKAYIARGKNDGILDEKYCMFTEESLKAYLQNYIERTV
ncbi:radical SAM protein [Breznakiellaceae bacterium SP9]